MKKESERLVYSTDFGSHCPECGRPAAACTCKADIKARVLGDGKVRVRRETKGRGGKTVTTISGLPLNQDDLIDLAKDFKRVCGSGGSVRDGTIEIQGDHCDRVIIDLQRRGFSAKRAGG